ncbi:MAG: FG-GAP repeat domain-containing protein, partial [Segetibacter sp.]
YSTYTGTYLGIGDGTFGPVSLSNPLPYGNEYDIETGDINGDGKQDYAGGQTYPSNGYGGGGESAFAGIHLGNGDGTFGAPGRSFASYHRLRDPFTLQDINNDNKLDILSPVAISGATCKCFTDYKGNGDGTFEYYGSQHNLPSSFTQDIYAVHAADVNGDGKQDAIAISKGYVAIFIGAANGTFITPSSYFPIFSNPDSGREGTDIITTDLNGDGKPDIVGSSPLGYGSDVFFTMLNTSGN